MMSHQSSHVFSCNHASLVDITSVIDAQTEEDFNRALQKKHSSSLSPPSRHPWDQGTVVEWRLLLAFRVAMSLLVLVRVASLYDHFPVVWECDPEWIKASWLRLNKVQGRRYCRAIFTDIPSI